MANKNTQAEAVEEVVEEAVVEKVVAPPVPEISPEDLVSICLPAPRDDEDNFITVSVNNEMVKIMKGVPVQIQRKYAEVIENAAIASNNARKYRDAQLKKMEDMLQHLA